MQNMTRTSWWRALATYGALLTGLALLASCGSGAPPNQRSYRMRVAADRHSLMNGVIEYPDVGRRDVDSPPFTFEVAVWGYQAVNSLSPSPGPKVRRKPVRIGGLVGVRLICTGIECKAVSHEKQNVLFPSDRGHWSWILTPHQPGTARLILSVTTYSKDTQNVLWENNPPIEEDVHVAATTSYSINRFFDFMKTFITLAGATTLGGVAIAIWRWWRGRRKTKVQNDKNANPAGARPAESSTKVDKEESIDRRQPPS